MRYKKNKKKTTKTIFVQYTKREREYIIQGAQTRFRDWKQEIERAKTSSESEGWKERRLPTGWQEWVGRVGE